MAWSWSSESFPASGISRSITYLGMVPLDGKLKPKKRSRDSEAGASDCRAMGLSENGAPGRRFCWQLVPLICGYGSIPYPTNCVLVPTYTLPLTTVAGANFTFDPSASRVAFWLLL